MSGSGVMNAAYAEGRASSPVLRYRLRCRAAIAHALAQQTIPFKGYYRVLDLGCADGRTLLELRERFGGRGEFVGVEASAELVAAAPSLPDDTRLLVGDVAAPPAELGEGSFDMVCALALLEHLPAPEGVVDVAAGLLKPGGIFVATCPHPLWDRLASRLGLLDDDAHLQHLDGRALHRLAERVGEARLVPFMTAPVGAVPYLGVEVPPAVSSAVDGLLRRLPRRLVAPLFVNQAVVAQRPG